MLFNPVRRARRAVPRPLHIFARAREWTRAQAENKVPVRYLLIVFAPRHAPSIGVEVGSAFAAFFLDETFLACVRLSASAAEVHDGFDELLEHLTVVPNVYLGEHREAGGDDGVRRRSGDLAPGSRAAPTLGELSATRRQSAPAAPTAPPQRARDERKVMFADGDSRSSTDVCSDVVSNNLKSYRSMRQLAEVGDESTTAIEPLEAMDTLEASASAGGQPRETAPKSPRDVKLPRVARASDSAIFCSSGSVHRAVRAAPLFLCVRYIFWSPRGLVFVA